MSKTYVVSDIHGMYDLMISAIGEIEKDSDGGTIIFTGDYIDRGPKSMQVVAHVMAGPSSGNWKWIPIRGNHEDMMLQCCNGDQIDWWVANGGGETINSYEGILNREHLMWMDGLPRLCIDKHRVYTHAGVSESYELDEQPEEITQWFRYPSKANVGYKDKHVVHGHTPQKDGPELYENRTNLDTGAFFTNRLVVGVFDDDVEGGPIKTIEVTL